MCGRFALGASQDDIAAMHGYNVQIGEWVGRDQFVPRFNVAPRTQAPVIRRRDDRGEGPSNRPISAPEPPEDTPALEPSHTSPRDTRSSEENIPKTDAILQTMRWGLVPHFAKHEDPHMKTINARAEALIEGEHGVWASIKATKRCAVVCQGYYEWQQKDNDRLPHFTKRTDGKLMLLAGLWDSVLLQGSTEPLWTFTIVTRQASKHMEWLHDRQPVILADAAQLALWLDTTAGTWSPKLSSLCGPPPESALALTCYQVLKEVGKVGAQSPAFIEPVAARKDGINALFARQAAVAAAHSPSQKRPRSSSMEPDTPLPDATHAGPPCETAPPTKKAATDEWEDDSDIEFIGQSSPSRPARSSAHASPQRRIVKQTPKKQRSSRKRTESSTKITSFFSRK